MAQTPALESANPLDKSNIPSEARHQQIVGQTGEAITKESSILIAIDGTEAGDKAFNYLLKSKVLSTNAHVFIATVLPANVLSGPWVSGPLSIDAKRQNELLKALREQAIEKLNPYKDKLKDAGYETTIHVAHGDARQTLVRVAIYHKVDLVVAGKRGKKGIPGLTAGSTTSYLVNHAPSPVLVIK
ncbi:adenine nucleotide alpha hydrolases-like protein [Microstroma glucosiphilum]|uniref:Adenine nucleotide alpha hydrolases-like protein n=1 Tax=Pseudomicrostroma glucosiphilum TaxID=1684307 RepID=A0A316UDN5_9BASI|nr:adenine nucleotide alpha hydrolases-like protein [Pseudomicrostroma glucosiphilum]PWN22964.1 adenine nucleotide alpha hydrolases-like protein [Pseudomicrostroma glucosiphilum]